MSHAPTTPTPTASDAAARESTAESDPAPRLSSFVSHAPKGKLGQEYSAEDGYALARSACMELLGVLKDKLGSLDQVAQVVGVADLDIDRDVQGRLRGHWKIVLTLVIGAAEFDPDLVRHWIVKENFHSVTTFQFWGYHKFPIFKFYNSMIYRNHCMFYWIIE